LRRDGHLRNDEPDHVIAPTDGADLDLARAGLGQLITKSSQGNWGLDNWANCGTAFLRASPRNTTLPVWSNVRASVNERWR